MVSGPDAEHQRRRHEPLDEPPPLGAPAAGTARQPALEHLAGPLEPVLDPQQRPGDPPEE